MKKIFHKTGCELTELYLKILKLRIKISGVIKDRKHRLNGYGTWKTRKMIKASISMSILILNHFRVIMDHTYGNSSTKKTASRANTITNKCVDKKGYFIKLSQVFTLRFPHISPDFIET